MAGLVLQFATPPNPAVKPTVKRTHARFSRSRNTPLQASQASGPLLEEPMHPHGFLAAAVDAFANHYPLALSPDHFWILVLQGLAEHMQLHAEALRARVVPFEGKKVIEIRRDGFSRHGPNDWAGTIPDFITGLIQHTQPGVIHALMPTFSTTTPIMEVAASITVMDICQHFFEYRMQTLCGFPTIRLLGTHADWIALQQRAQAIIAQLCLPEFAAEWGTAVDSVLSRCSDAWLHPTTPDEGFWGSMIKQGSTKGSGACTYFNGWVNVFFPILPKISREARPNPSCVPFTTILPIYVRDVRTGSIQEHAQTYILKESEELYLKPLRNGPNVLDFPLGLAVAPVTWQYFTENISLLYKSGFVGVTQDPITKELQPEVGWLITEKASVRVGGTVDEDDLAAVRDAMIAADADEDDAAVLFALSNWNH